MRNSLDAECKILQCRLKSREHLGLKIAPWLIGEQVVELAETAGFKLLAKSEVNANPKDTRDHPEGVWTLPPSLRLKDKDREKYLGIGESDRMTLKFVKPLQ